MSCSYARSQRQLSRRLRQRRKRSWHLFWIMSRTLRSKTSTPRSTVASKRWTAKITPSRCRTRASTRTWCLCTSSVWIHQPQRQSDTKAHQVLRRRAFGLLSTKLSIVLQVFLACRQVVSSRCFSRSRVATCASPTVGRVLMSLHQNSLRILHDSNPADRHKPM